MDQLPPHNVTFDKFYKKNMKLFLIFFATILWNTLYSQENDVRKTRWGMTMAEVITSEYPMTPNKVTDSELIYENVELSHSQLVTISYDFKNKQLSEVTYSVYGFNSGEYKGTCKNIVSLNDKVRFTSFVFDALKEKGFKCEIGWDLVNCFPRYPVGYNNCNLDKTTIDQVEKAAADAKCDKIGLGFANERSEVFFYFNQYQNIYKPDWDDVFPCNGIFYNTYYRLVFSPGPKVQKEQEQSDF